MKTPSKPSVPTPPLGDAMGRAWFALALTLGLLLMVEWAWPRLGPWTQHFRPTAFLTQPQAQPLPSVVVAGAKSERLEPIQALFKELRAGSRKRLRIAYFADSITEGDTITEQLRRDLQARYGGKGLGFQGFYPKDAPSRLSLQHLPGGSWERHCLHDLKQDASLALGLDGCVYSSLTQTTLTLEGHGKARPGWYERSRLFWGPGSVQITVDGQAADFSGTKAVNVAVLPFAPRAKLQMTIEAASTVPLYGVSLESVKGVQLDNFTLRGDSGEGLAHLPAPVIQGFGEAMDYDLVVVHFGINALTYGGTRFTWYRKALVASLQHLKKAFPGARFLVVSAMDRGLRQGVEIVSDPAAGPVIEAQRAAALQEGDAYIDLLATFGGPGVMKAWTEAIPPLAFKDYTHVNRQGGAKIAKELLGYLDPEEAHASR